MSFARSSVLIIGDYPQVPQVRGTLIFPIFTSGKNMNKLFPLSCVRIEENETKISIKKGSIHPSIRENLFSVALTWTSAVQGSRCYLIGFEKWKIYIAISGI